MAKKAARGVKVRKPAKSAKSARTTATKKAAKKKPPGKGSARKKPEQTLGRPLVTAEEKLYMLFREDYHARQVFEFLRVNTVGELEQFSPQQIIHLLSAPVRKTVEGIRERLAAQKRHLRDDIEFALEYRQNQHRD